MSSASDDAVVLRLADFSETSQIVTLFGRQRGQLRLIAKGLRRHSRARFAVGLDLLERGDVQYAPPRGERELGTLIAWQQRDPYADLRRAAAPLYAGLYAAELVAALTAEHDPNPALFDSFCAALSDFPGVGAVGPRVVRFQRELLSAIGYLPELGRCTACGTPAQRGEPAYFSASAGGLVCRNCEAQHVEKRGMPTIVVGKESAEAVAAAWFSLLDYYARHLAGRRMATSDMLLNQLLPISR